MLIQIILVLFFLYAIFKVIGRFRARELTFPRAILWAGFWVVAGIVVLLPNSTSYFARLAGVGRGADLVVYIALVIIFFSLFRLLIMVEKMKKEITLLTRKGSVEEAGKKHYL